MLDGICVVSSLLFVVDFNSYFNSCTVHFLSSWQWHSGAIAVFFNYMLILMDMRDFPSLGGSFVSMFLQILSTFLKVVLALIVYILSFAIVFISVLPTAEHFNKRGPAFLTTFSMTLGELDFTGLYESAILPRPADEGMFGTVFFLLFCVCMPIAFINLLVGLAVSDVGALTRNAKIAELTSKLEMILEWDFSLPTYAAERFDLLSARPCEREAWLSCPQEWETADSQSMKQRVAKKAFEPKGFFFFSNRGIVNRILCAFHLPINTEVTDELQEALNGQTDIDHIKEQLSNVQELLTKVLNSKIHLHKRVTD